MCKSGNTCRCRRAKDAAAGATGEEEEEEGEIRFVFLEQSSLDVEEEALDDDDGDDRAATDARFGHWLKFHLRLPGMGVDLVDCDRIQVVHHPDPSCRMLCSGKEPFSCPLFSENDRWGTCIYYVQA